MNDSAPPVIASKDTMDTSMRTRISRLLSPGATSQPRSAGGCFSCEGNETTPGDRPDGRGRAELRTDAATGAGGAAHQNHRLDVTGAARRPQDGSASYGGYDGRVNLFPIFTTPPL